MEEERYREDPNLERPRREESFPTKLAFRQYLEDWVNVKESFPTWEEKHRISVWMGVEAAFAKTPEDLAVYMKKVDEKNRKFEDRCLAGLRDDPEAAKLLKAKYDTHRNFKATVIRIGGRGVVPSPEYTRAYKAMEEGISGWLEWRALDRVKAQYGEKGYPY